MPDASNNSARKARSPRTTQRAKTTKTFRERFTREKIHRFMFGSKDREGFLKQFVVYALLICIGFIYVYPILHMVSSSLMTLDDLLDSSIKWLPSSLNFANYEQAATSMDFWNALWQSIVIAGVPTICNLMSCSVTGYALARFDFKGKKIVMGIIILSFVLPSQITMIPTYVLYSNLGILNTIWAFILPAMFAQGFKAPIFILIFWQFFRQIPKALIEASRIDGAGHFKSFFKIALPSAKPAFITVALFSFVWYWNESYLTELYVHGVYGQSEWTTLVVQLDNFAANYSSYQQTATNAATNLNESINMAGTLLSILPLMILYFVLQRHFVESIDRTGITGE